MTIKASLYSISTEDGGRIAPILSEYRGMFYIDDYTMSECIVILPHEHVLYPGKAVVLSEIIIINPHYLTCIDAGLGFSLREDGQVVAIGQIYSIHDHDS